MARSIDGANDKIIVTADSTIDDFTDHTICCWVYPRSAGHGTTLGRIFEKNGLPKLLYISGTDGSNVGLGYYIQRATTSLAWAQNNNFIPLDEWSFLAVGLDATADAAFVKAWDNTLTQTQNISPSAGSGAPATDNASDLYIGCNNTTARTFDGRIAQMRYFNTYISDDNVLLSLARGDLRNDPALSLTLDGIDSPEPDESGNGNSGALTNTSRANGPPIAPNSRTFWNSAVDEVAAAAGGGISSAITTGISIGI